MPRYILLRSLALFWGLALLAVCSLSWAAELKGFSINTQDKNVTVTLFTDQRVSYNTDNRGKQFTITLPETQLSQEQIDNGLPVVLDNKNRFIGRAVPGEDGKVKIILPNLAANDYTVSIQQQHTKQPIEKPTALPSEKLAPRPAIPKQAASQFERVASRFPKTTDSKENGVSKPSTNRMKLNPAPMKATQSGIWNPYVYRPSDFPKETATRRAAQNAPGAAPPKTEPINTLSVAESVMPPASSTAVQASPATASPKSDPLWYLHTLPPAQATPADDLQGPAAVVPPAQETLVSPLAVSKAEPNELQELASEIRKGLKATPKWLIITLGLFLGGIGLFCIIGGMVLLKVLFSQAKQSFGNTATATPLPYLTGLVPLYQPPAEPAASNKQTETPPKFQEPKVALKFEDKSAIKAMDYLKKSPTTVSQAIHNSRIIRLQNRKKPAFRDMAKANPR